MESLAYVYIYFTLDGSNPKLRVGPRSPIRPPLPVWRDPTGREEVGKTIIAMSGTNRYLNRGREGRRGGGYDPPQSGATGPWVCSPQEAEEANLDPQGWFCTDPGTIDREGGGGAVTPLFFFSSLFTSLFGSGSDIEAQISLPAGQFLPRCQPQGDAGLLVWAGSPHVGVSESLCWMDE